MPEMKVENWNGHPIRFVHVNGAWMAVLKDICDALELKTFKVSQQLPKDILFRYTLSTSGGPQEMLLVNEIGIYKTVFRSHKPEAENFQNWVYNMLCELRKSIGLEGFEIFRMLDKEHQKEAMKRLQDGLRQPRKVDYIKANTIADKAVSSRYGHPKMVKKSDMSPEMLAEREAILDDTVQLMALNDKYGMGISVSQTIYQAKGTNHYANR